MSIVKLISAAVLALPVVLSACGGDDRPQAASAAVQSGSTTQQTDYEASERIYSRGLRK